MEELGKLTQNKYNIRLIGMHRTHMNTIRPMYQLKKKIKEDLWIDGKKYEVYDRWNTPYEGYLNFILSPGDIEKGCAQTSERTYMFATHNSKHWFIKKEGNEYKICPKIDGLLLSEIMKFGMINFYDRIKMRKQILGWIKDEKIHPDPHEWNIIVDGNSNMHLIDDGGKSMFGSDKETARKILITLLNKL
jgi:hypothetical protein